MGSLKRKICYFESLTMKGHFFSIIIVLLHVKVTVKRQNLGFEQVSTLDVHKSFVLHRIFSKHTFFIYITPITLYFRYNNLQKYGKNIR